eukprot:scaffold513_cov169-Amphora_coffeaeformis.AAC.11
MLGQAPTLRGLEGVAQKSSQRVVSSIPKYSLPYTTILSQFDLSYNISSIVSTAFPRGSSSKNMTSKTSEESLSSTSPIIVHSIPGSQFVAKVLSALQHRKIPHFVKAVPLDKKQRVKVIPSGGLLVPEIKVGTGESALIVSGSENILQWIDKNFPQAQLYPKESSLASELSVRASDSKLAGFVWYYNWVNPKGFSRSILHLLRGALLPSWLSFLVPDFVLALALQSEKAKFRRQACQAIFGFEEDPALDDETRMQSILVEELMYFQSQLSPENGKLYMMSSAQPTAADFSIYPQLERLVGDKEGSSYDVGLEPALPELLEMDSLQRLWKWHSLMRQTCPVQFKGKKPPPELV